MRFLPASHLAAALCLALLTACPSTTSTTDGGNLTAKLTVTGITPPNGSILDETAINIAGTGFTAPMRVWIANQEATSVTVVNDIRISAKAEPYATVGPVDVQVQRGDGQKVTLTSGYTYTTPQVKLDCKLQWPLPGMTGDAGQPTPSTYGHVTIQGVTDTGSAPANMLAQVGYGASGSAPAGWSTWQDTTWNPTCTTCSGDAEYIGTFTTPTTGTTYDYTYRFAYDNGTTVYCDKDGVTDGGHTNGVGVLTVNGGGSGGTHSIGWCILQGPATLDAGTSRASPAVYGRVFVDGVTGKASQPAGVVAQLGWGGHATAPATWAAGNWSTATWNSGCLTGDGTDCGNNSEYQGTFPTPATAATYDYAYRFQVDGSSWSYCDTSGNKDGTTVTGNYGVAVVGAGGGGTTAPPSWCFDKYPPILDAGTGAVSDVAYGRVFAGVGITGRATAPAGLVAQIGYGNKGTAPAKDASWHWTTTTGYTASCGDCGDNNSEYFGSVTAPSTAGAYDYTWRFSYNGSAYKYCDTVDADGSNVDGGSTGWSYGTLNVH